jgi:hypothetical protein
MKILDIHSEPPISFDSNSLISIGAVFMTALSFPWQSISQQAFIQRKWSELPSYLFLSGSLPKPMD